MAKTLPYVAVIAYSTGPEVYRFSRASDLLEFVNCCMADKVCTWVSEFEVRA